MAESVDLTKTTITDLPTSIDIQKAPAIYSDKPAALAVALGITVDSVLSVCQHDGSAIICDQTFGDAKFQGFNVQDMVDICLLAGLTVTEVDLAAGDDAPPDYEREVCLNHKRVIVEWERFFERMLNSQGLAVFQHRPDLPGEYAIAYRGDGKTVTFIDPYEEIKFVYKDQNDLVARGIYLISLLQIEKAK